MDNRYLMGDNHRFFIHHLDHLDDRQLVLATRKNHQNRTITLFAMCINRCDTVTL